MAIKTRENLKTCPVCGGQADLGYHHIIPRSESGGGNPENLVKICKDCHDLIEENPHLWARFLRCYTPKEVRKLRRKYSIKRRELPKKGIPMAFTIICGELGVDKKVAEKLIGIFAITSGTDHHAVVTGIRNWYRGEESQWSTRMGNYLKDVKENLERKKEVT